MKHYYTANPDSKKGFDEVTETEFYALLGTDETRPYASKVYRGEISLEEVPAELQEAIQTIVNNKIARWGEYANREISSNEFYSMLKEVL